MTTQYEKSNFGTNSIGIIVTIPSIQSTILAIMKDKSFDDANSRSFLPRKEVTTMLDSTGEKEISLDEERYTNLKPRKHDLAKFLGTWHGNDIDDTLNIVYSSRSKF